MKHLADGERRAWPAMTKRDRQQRQQHGEAARCVCGEIIEAVLDSARNRYSAAASAVANEI